MTQSFLNLLLTQAWQIAVISIIVAVIVRIAAINRPHIAHALWILVLIKCITPPLWGHSLGVFSRLQTWTELNDETAPSDINTSNVQKATFVIEPPSVEVQFPPEPMLQPSDSIAAIGEFDEIEFESLAELSYPQPTDIESEISPSLIEPEEQISQTALIPLTAESNAPSVHRVWLLIGLVFGAIVTLFIMIVRCLHCVRQIQLHRTTEFDDPLRDRLQQLAAQLGIRRIPNIIVSDVLFGPAVLGLLRHTIVLPRCLFPSELLPSSTPPLAFLDPILAHELLHIRRGDLRTGTLQAIVQSLWWFHPAVWFCNRRLSREAERCCDEQVIAELGCTPGQYARSLLSVIECKHQLQPIPVFPGMKPVEITSQRMERIMSLKNGLKKRTPLWCWLMIVALAFVVLPGAVAKPTPDEKPAVTEPFVGELQESAQAKEDSRSFRERKGQVKRRNFEGNKFWSNGDLEKHLVSKTTLGNAPGEVFNPDMIPADTKALTDHYRNIGFFDVKVLGSARFSRDRSSVVLAYTVTEGCRYTIREIRFEGNNRISTSDLQHGSNLKPGDEYSAFETSRDIQRIRELYKGLGLEPSAINPVPHFIEERGIFDLVFEIDEEPTALLSKKTYEIRDLLTRLAEDQAISMEEARKCLIGIFEQAVPPVIEVPQGFLTFSKVAATPSLPLPPAPKHLSSISLDGDQLAVLQCDAGHVKLNEEIDRFRRFGFRRFQVTARFITGNAEEINALMSSLKMEAPFSNTTGPVLAPQHDAAHGVKPEQSAITTVQMGESGIVSRDKVRAIEDLARSKTKCLIVACAQVQSFNGQAAMTQVGETKPYIIGFNENGKPMIRLVTDGLILHITPIVAEEGILRLQCLSGMEEEIAQALAVSVPRPAGESPKQIEVPVITSKRVQAYFELKVDQALWLSGLTATKDGKNQAALVVLEVTPISLQHYLVDQPLHDMIKTVDEPHGFQVVDAPKGIVRAAKPKEHPIANTAEAASLRVPAMPPPEWIEKSSDPLVKLVWDARNASQRRLLMTDQRTPWQFMNGLAALRRDFLIRDGNEAVVGLDWLQHCKEFPVMGRFLKTADVGQAKPLPTPVLFGDDVLQLVATLAMNDVPLDATFATTDGTITMGDMVKHLQMTTQDDHVSPWTVVSLMKYMSPDAEWVNAKGEEWSIEKILKCVLVVPSTKWKTNWLMAITFARDQYLRTGRPLRGVWLEAQDEIASVIQQTELRSIAAGEIRPLRIDRPQLLYAPFGNTTFPYRYRPGGTLDVSMATSYYDFYKSPGRETLLFLVAAVPDNRLQKDWLRNSIEVAANELIADHRNKEIRSPFYETTQALTIYLERVAGAGLSAQVARDQPVKVFVKGLVQNPGSYQYVGNNDLRLLEVITRAGGPLNESADTVSIIRNVGKQPEPTVLQVNLKRLKSGADPNFYVMPGDEVLVHTADIVKQPLEASIRLADDFVLSPESPISGSTVILFLNDKPITVEKFIAGGWDRLQRTQGIPDDLKRAIVCELIKTDLPQFVYREILLQHFAVEAPEYKTDDTAHERFAADKLFLETFERNSSSVADPQKQAQFLAAVLAKSSTSSAMEKKKIQLAQYTRRMGRNTLDKSEARVIRHVQTLVMKADLRRTVSLDFKDASLTDVLRSIAADHNLNIAARNLEIASRIVDKPATVTFHCEVRPLGEALTAIVEPFGLSAHPDGETLIVEFANFEAAMAKFRSLPGPPSFAVYGIVKNTGWHKLEKEVRLLDAIEMAGGVEDSEGVSIAITNADIIDGKAIPVSMSLRVLQVDKSGKLNRIINDGDIITVARNVSAEAPRAKRPEVLMFGNGVNSDSGLVGTFQFDDPAEPIVLRGVGLVSNLSHGHQAADVKSVPNHVPASECLVLCTYALADLVVYRQPSIVSVSRSTKHTEAAGTVPPRALALAPEKTEPAPQPRRSTQPQQTQTAAAYNADFAPLTELIKASVQPESWDPHGNATMAINKETLSLVIRQTEPAHDEIAELLSQLRNAQDQSVHIRCRILELTDETDSKWLVENFPLHELQHGTRWALLSRQRSEAFQLSLRKRKTSILSVPQVMTISGQSATIQVGTTNPESDIATGIRLQLTPHVLTDSKVIRMQHSFSIGSFDHEMPLPMESLVGSGQTLLILIDNPADSDDSKAAKSKYLLLMTPNYVPVPEEEELIATPIQFP